MSPHQVIAVAARLLAVWMAVRLPALAWSVLFVPGSDPKAESPRVLAGVILLTTIIVVILLWVFPKTIARKLLVSSSPEPPTPPPSSADEWLRMGCALIGLWLLATCIPSLVLDAYVLFSANLDDVSFFERRPVIYYLAEVGIGFWLVLGGKGFRALFWWASTAGVSKRSG